MVERTRVRILKQPMAIHQKTKGNYFDPIHSILFAIELHRTLPSTFRFEDFTDLAADREQPSIVVARRNKRYPNWHPVLALETWNIDYRCVQCLRDY